MPGMTTAHHDRHRDRQFRHAAGFDAAAKQRHAAIRAPPARH